MGGELGALSNYSHEEDKSIVNGAHETSTAQQLVDKFIDKFVLCPNCKLPEIDMMVKKGFFTIISISGSLQFGHKTNLSINLSTSCCAVLVSCAPFTIDLSSSCE